MSVLGSGLGALLGFGVQRLGFRVGTAGLCALWDLGLSTHGTSASEWYRMGLGFRI